MTLFDYVFVISAILFNLLIAGIFIAQKQERTKLVRTFGITWLCLAFPLAIVFINYIDVGREPRILISFSLIFLYMVVELLLDYVLKIDFRKKPITHIPYIILEYIALFSLIFISIDINPSWGWVVSISFWILMASLIYLIRGRKENRASES
jgi:hypothetical protein